MRLTLLCAVFCLSCAPSARAQWRVGAAQAAINPAAGAFIAGHTRDRHFRDVHDDIHVKAVVVSDSRGRSVAILAFDCIGLLHPQLLEIRAGVAQRLRGKGLDTSRIVMSSTHTHSGPDVVGLWGRDLLHSGVDPAYMSMLVQVSVEQVVKAWSGRRKARAIHASSVHGEGWVYNISQPAETDRSLTLLQFRDAEGRSVATLTNFACHPTILDGEHDRVSSDYVGGFYRRMDSLHGGVNLFLQGAIGGWVQPEHEAKTFAQAFYRGRVLADAASQALAAAGSPLQGRGVGHRSRRFLMPVDNPGFRQLASMGVINRRMTDSVETEVAVFRIGEAMFATHPGETVPALSLATKALMRTEGPRFILGLGMDAMGYILKPEFFDASRGIPHSPYLCSMSAGPRTQGVLLDVLTRLLSEPF